MKKELNIIFSAPGIDKSEAKPSVERNEGREKTLIHPKPETKKRQDKKTLNSR